MSARSTTDQSQFLVSRTVAESRRQGTIPSSDEATALFESIAWNLLLNPRAVLLFVFYAKNGLRSSLLSVLSLIDSLEKSITDLNNPTFNIKDPQNFNQARNSLLQIEQLSKVSSSSPQFKKFDKSISDILNKSLAKGVKKPNTTSLVRPGTEAEQDLVSDFEQLKSQYDDFLDRLYALSVGVDNFFHSPLSTIIGLTTVSRAREDIESIIDLIESDGSIEASRDLAIRLITDRASLKIVGDLPKLADPVISASADLPRGYSLQCESSPSKARIQSSIGPFVFSGPSVVTNITVSDLNTQDSVSLTDFPQTGFSVLNRAVVVGSKQQTSFTIPANYFITGQINGTNFKLGPLTVGTFGVSAIAANITALAAVAPSPVNGLRADPYVSTASNRIVVSHSSASTITITEELVTVITEVHGLVTYNYDSKVPIDVLGLSGRGQSGSTDAQYISDGFKYLASTLVTSSVTSDGRVLIETIEDSPGTTLTVSSYSVLGMNSSVVATSDSIRLFGSVLGVQTDPVSPIGLVDIGDKVNINNIITTVVAITNEVIQVSTQLQTTRGAIIVNSGLYVSFSLFINQYRAAVRAYARGRFASDLNKLELYIAALRAGATQSQRSDALGFLEELKNELNALLVVVNSLPTPNPLGATEERNIVSGIIASLEERKFDRCLDLFMRCKIQEALDCEYETASYAGSFLNASSEFARTDIKVPNRALDEEVESRFSQEDKGV